MGVWDRAMRQCVDLVGGTGAVWELVLQAVDDLTVFFSLKLMLLWLLLL